MGRRPGVGGGGRPRPVTVPCERCGADVAVHATGRLPRFCEPCAYDREREAVARKRDRESGTQARRRTPAEREAVAGRSPGEVVAERLVDRRLRIEQARPLIAMALLTLSSEHPATPILREAYSVLDCSP